MQQNILFEVFQMPCTYKQYNPLTLNETVSPESKLLFAEERFVLFPSAEEGVPEKEKPLENPELNSSPGKGDDKESRPGEGLGCAML